MEPCLRILSPKVDRPEIPLADLPLTIGRSREAKVRLAHDQVSRVHCEISSVDGLLFVRDLGSTNGTFVDGERVLESPLLPGARLEIGSVRLLADYGDDPPTVVSRAGSVADTHRTGNRTDTFRIQDLSQLAEALLAEDPSGASTAEAEPGQPRGEDLPSNRVGAEPPAESRIDRLQGVGQQAPFGQNPAPQPTETTQDRPPARPGPASME